MFARVAVQTVQAATPAGARLGAVSGQSVRHVLQVRFNTSHATSNAFARGSKGRDMPPMKYRTPTLPNANRPARATFTIRVGEVLYFSVLVLVLVLDQVQTNDPRSVTGWSSLRGKAIWRQQQHLGRSRLHDLPRRLP
jgi:hypothetical protein